MGTWNAFYVKAENDAAIFLVRKEFPDAEIEADGEFVAVTMKPDECKVPEFKLSAIAARLRTDVYWLSFQSTVDAFQFYHWRAGELVRALVFGCFEEERTWERVEGTPEPWEREVFFKEKRFKYEYAETKEAKRIYREAELRKGREVPRINSRNCAHEIAKFYGFPGYG